MANSDALNTGTVQIIDPSLFTPAYDAALIAALRGEGVLADLNTRPPRPGETLPDVAVKTGFYRRFDMAPKKFGPMGAALKAGEHIIDMLRAARTCTASLVHFQWLPFPLADRLLIPLWRRKMPVVVTVHDTTPFNASPTSRVQGWGFKGALAQADRLIVHTGQGRLRLVAMGLDPEKITVIPHGIFDPKPGTRAETDRWTIVAFGKIRPYKGIDILIDALALLPENIRARLNVIIAGEPLMDMAPITSAIANAGLEGCVDLQLGHLDDAQMEALFAKADSFVFPYREIEASGVLYQIVGLRRWIIASDIGAFKEVLAGTSLGDLVPAEEVPALSAAIEKSVRTCPEPSGDVAGMTWSEVAVQTKKVYEDVLGQKRTGAMRLNGIEYGVGT